MTGFAKVSDPHRPLRIVQIGAGGMGRAWLRVLADSTDVELVGIVDLDEEAAKRGALEYGDSALPVARHLGEVLDRISERGGPGADEASQVDAVLNVTIPIAHHAVSSDALNRGLPVLSEKPAAPTVAEALSLGAVSSETGRLLMISQSRRYYRNLDVFKTELGRLGPVGILTNDFFKAPHFGGFRETMPFPLLVDMAIHPFDVARFLLDSDPVSVYAQSFNPGWSWFAGDAAAAATFEFADGIRFVYTGSWVSPGFETAWNGSWRASARDGTILWNGEDAPTVMGEDPSRSPVEPAHTRDREEIAGSLAEFVEALRTGVVPSGEIHRNVMSLVMVEAAVLSATRGERVLMADLIDDAFGQAISDEVDDRVRRRLEEERVDRRVSFSGWRRPADE